LCAMQLRRHPARDRVILAVQGALIGAAVVLHLLSGFSGVAVGGLAVIFGALLIHALRPCGMVWVGPHWSSLAWLGSLFVVFGLMLRPGLGQPWLVTYAWCSGLIAVAILPAAWVIGHPRRQRAAKILALSWALIGNGFHLVGSYLDNQGPSFHLALLLMVVVLLLARFGFRLSSPAVITVHSLILMAVFLPIIDPLIRRPLNSRETVGVERGYAFETARRHPEDFRRWWRAYLEEWERMAADVFMPDPEGVLPLRLRPGAVGRLGQSRVVINRRGFRGGDIEGDRGDTYRIVALGESTTFGCTLEAADRPWPELLEDRIRSCLLPGRKVEVINAGVPACDLVDNLHRLEGEILPLEPDLLLSYHGYNGRHLMRGVVAGAPEADPPAYRSRPLRLLGDVEYRWRLWIHRARTAAGDDAGGGGVGADDLLAGEYAEAYRRLMLSARERGIALAVANFALAVGRGSDPAVIEFYRAAFPSVYWVIEANDAHTRLLGLLAAEHREIRLVDVQSRLHGRHAYFIDLVHFTQEGRQVLADAFFEEIRPVLIERDLIQDSAVEPVSELRLHQDAAQP